MGYAPIITFKDLVPHISSSEKQTPTLLLLDCCCSGGAVDELEKASSSALSRIQVLAGCGSDEEVPSCGERSFSHIFASFLECVPNDGQTYGFSVNDLCNDIVALQAQKELTHRAKQGSQPKFFDLVLRVYPSEEWYPRKRVPVILSELVVDYIGCTEAVRDENSIRLYNGGNSGAAAT